MARNDVSFISGLLTGALVGASLAMVLAPSAEDTREILRAKALAAADRAAGATSPDI